MNVTFEGGKHFVRKSSLPYLKYAPPISWMDLRFSFSPSSAVDTP